MYSDQEREEGDGRFDLGFFGGLLHSPLSNFDRLRRSLHPSLQVGCLSLYPSLQVGLFQLPFLLGVCSGSGSVLLLCQDNLIDDTCEVSIPANLKQYEM